MKERWIIGLALLIALAIAGAYYFSMQVSGDKGNTVDFVGLNDTTTTVHVEIADTPREQQQGLMYRTAMDENKGMLFIFDGDFPRSFWMENTPLPLDMIFINSRNTIVDINHNATPYSTDVFTSRAGCKYVVEVNGGFCQRHDVKIGDLVNIDLRST